MDAVDFKAVFDSSPNSYMLLDRELRFVAANAAYVRASGVPLDRLIGRHLFEAFPHDPDDPRNESARVLRESLERVLSSGAPDVIAFIPYRVPVERNGEATLEERFWSATHTPILDARGEVRLILQHTVDITDLHRPHEDAAGSRDEAGVLQRARRVQELNDSLTVERQSLKKLEAERERLLERERFLNEAIPQHVWTADLRGELTSVNRRLLDYFGVSEIEVIRSGWRRFMHEDDLDVTAARWAESLRTGQPYEVEFRLRRADGVYRWHLSRAVPATDATGTMSQWFGTNTDIDDRKRAQDEIVERSAYEQQLIGIVSHDLRNPINAISIAAALLAKHDQFDEFQAKAVSRIVSSSDRARRLLRDFLDFAQARSTGRLPVLPGPANLRQIARQVFDELRTLHPMRTATIDHEGIEEGTWDADRLAQVIGNLLSNAYQHSAPGDAVRVRTRGEDNEAVIEVQNEGVPIPAADIPRLFLPFKRGTGTTTEEHGVGLGLFISKEIVAAHRGTIRVRSTAEEGTVFTVRLPRHV